ncbi:MAG: hypothetical protein JWO68_260, partial [Actinomycetia bacterium]|nr:hypothetical protein [Actinomycetes bacterium]
MTDSVHAAGPLSELGFDGHAVVAAAGRAIIVTDAEGTIVSWNPAAEHLYGWAEQEVLGQDVREVLL